MKLPFTTLVFVRDFKSLLFQWRANNHHYKMGACSRGFGNIVSVNRLILMCFIMVLSLYSATANASNAMVLHHEGVDVAVIDGQSLAHRTACDVDSQCMNCFSSCFDSSSILLPTEYLPLLITPKMTRISNRSVLTQFPTTIFHPPMVNVHIPYGGEIPGTDASIAFNDLQAISSAFPDKEAPLVIYCRSGSMSRQTAQRLVQMGYQNVIDIAGGSNAWRNLGNPWVVR